MRSSIFVLAVSLLSACGPPPCEQYFCGCFYDATLSVAGNTRDATNDMPVSGIIVSCVQASGVMDTTDSSGTFGFDYATRQSPGCGYEGCNWLRFEDPSGTFQPQEMTVWELREAGGRVALSR